MLAAVVIDPQESGSLEGANLIKAGVRCACAIYTRCRRSWVLDPSRAQ